MLEEPSLLGCYLEEAGDTGLLPSATSPIQPLLCVLGLSLDLGQLKSFTLEFLDLKYRFFPRLCHPSMRLQRILNEIKGAEIRAAFRSGAPNHHLRHHHIGFLDALLDLVDRYGCRIFGRVWVKPLAGAFAGQAIYTSSAQSICSTFQHLLDARDELGMVIPDSRRKVLDQRVSFSIFTQKFRALGDPYPRIVEMPVFGQSVNHAGIQVCDLLCSGLLFPIAAFTFCTGYVHNRHVESGYAALKTRYAARLRQLQHRHQNQAAGRWLGGIVVSDPLGQRSGSNLFK